MSTSPKPGYADSKPELASRLRKIEGRVRGIEKMVAADRYCIEILTQIAAARTALERVGLEILDGHVTHCVHDAIASGDSDAASVKSQELLEAVERFVKMR